MDGDSMVSITRRSGAQEFNVKASSIDWSLKAFTESKDPVISWAFGDDTPEWVVTSYRSSSQECCDRITDRALMFGTRGSFHFGSGLDVPNDVIESATKVEHFFATHNIDQWEFLGIASRKAIDQANKNIASLTGRAARAEKLCEDLRSCLVGLVGVDEVEALKYMDRVMSDLAPESEKALQQAIRMLIATHPSSKRILDDKDAVGE